MTQCVLCNLSLFHTWFQVLISEETWHFRSVCTKMQVYQQSQVVQACLPTLIHDVLLLTEEIMTVALNPNAVYVWRTYECDCQVLEASTKSNFACSINHWYCLVELILLHHDRMTRHICTYQQSPMMSNFQKPWLPTEQKLTHWTRYGTLDILFCLYVACSLWIKHTTCVARMEQSRFSSTGG